MKGGRGSYRAGYAGFGALFMATHAANTAFIRQRPLPSMMIAICEGKCRAETRWLCCEARDIALHAHMSFSLAASSSSIFLHVVIRPVFGFCPTACAVRPQRSSFFFLFFYFVHAIAADIAHETLGSFRIFMRDFAISCARCSDGAGIGNADGLTINGWVSGHIRFTDGFLNCFHHAFVPTHSPSAACFWRGDITDLEDGQHGSVRFDLDRISRLVEAPARAQCTEFLIEGGKARHPCVW